MEETTAATLALLGQKVRNIRGQGMVEGASTRLLIYAAMLIAEGLPVHRAIELAIVHSVTDDADIRRSIREIASALFE